MNHPYADASEVTIEVKDGLVTLEGPVDEQHVKHEIENIADGCMGVKDVDNKICVSAVRESSSESIGNAASSASSTVGSPGSTTQGTKKNN
jgi:hypothetical protein